MVQNYSDEAIKDNKSDENNYYQSQANSMGGRDVGYEGNWHTAMPKIDVDKVSEEEKKEEQPEPVRQKSPRKQ